MNKHRYASANLDFGNHEIEFLGPDGKPLNKKDIEVSSDDVDVNLNQEVSEKTFIKKVYSTFKKFMHYTPIGYSYTISKSLMAKMDRFINEVKIDPTKMLSIKELSKLIKENKYKFNELNLIFTPEQALIIDTKELESDIKDSQIWLDFDKKENGSLTINIRYLTD